jgi:hypothetical protein
LYQIDDQPDEQSEKYEWGQKNDGDPNYSADGGYIAADLGSVGAAQLASDYGRIAANFGTAIEAEIAGYGGDIARDLPLILEINAAADGGRVSVDLTTNVNAATDAGDLAEMIVWAYPHGVADVGLIGIIRGERRQGYRKAEQRKHPAKVEAENTIDSRHGLNL